MKNYKKYDIILSRVSSYIDDKIWEIEIFI